MSNLFAHPLRLAFVEKGIQSFAEVTAHVAHEDEVFALLAREPPLQPRQRLLRGASVSGAFPAMTVASSSTRCCRAGRSSTTSLSSPSVAASSAPTSRAVKIGSPRVPARSTR